MSLEQELADRLQTLEVELPASQIEQLARYAQLLWDWNTRLNLTRHTTPEQFVTRDIYDTWQLSRLIAEGEDVLDVGSGGGVPGALLAILRPGVEVTLCESIGKKAKVLTEMIRALGLPCRVHHARAEELLDDLRFAVLTARAVGPLWKLCTWFGPHWASIGRLLAIKGPGWTEERAEARHRGVLRGLELRRAVHYTIPGTDIESSILKIWHGGRPEPASELNLVSGSHDDA